MANELGGAETAPRVSPKVIAVLGVGLALISVLFLYLVYEFWPRVGADAQGVIPDSDIHLFGAVTFKVTAEVRLILLAIIAGALGSFIHAATSFVDYVGERKFLSSWIWWYLLRPFIGATLALIFYFVVRAGFFATSANASSVSPFGTAATAALVGMFSKQAIDKLRELFDTLFKVETTRSEGLARPAGEGAGGQQPVVPAVPAANGTPPAEEPPAGQPEPPPGAPNAPPTREG
jgi:hypothetical protein